MDFSSYFPIWNKLSASEKEQLSLLDTIKSLKKLLNEKDKNTL